MPFFTTIREIFLDETLRNFYFEHSFTSKTLFCDFCAWFTLVLLKKCEGFWGGSPLTKIWHNNFEFTFILLRNHVQIVHTAYHQIIRTPHTTESLKNNPTPLTTITKVFISQFFFLNGSQWVMNVYFTSQIKHVTYKHDRPTNERIIR